jgi:hypothetical protein
MTETEMVLYEQAEATVRKMGDALRELKTYSPPTGWRKAAWWCWRVLCEMCS